MTRLFRATAFSVLAFLLPVAAFAQQRGPVETRLDQAKVERAADGKEAFVAADAMKPGEVIQYTATYRNTGAQPVRNLQATIPVPAQTELVPGSEQPAGAEASLDGIDFGTLPLKRKKRVQGKDVLETVPMREVRYVRWTAPVLGPGQSMAFVARVRVLDDAPARAGPGARP